jgi:uncharacterized membrane protein
MAADAPVNPPEAAPQKPRRTWLYASVALNLLLAGVLIGHLASGPRHHKFVKHAPPAMAVRDVGFAFMRALPEERRKEVKKKMKAEFGSVKPLFEDSIAARREAFALLEKDTITAAEIEAALDKAQAVDSKVADRSAQFFAKVVVEIPAGERKAAVAEMRKRWTARESLRWKGGEDGERRGPPDGPPPMGEGGPPPKDVLMPSDAGPPPPHE